MEQMSMGPPGIHGVHHQPDTSVDHSTQQLIENSGLNNLLHDTTAIEMDTSNMMPFMEGEDGGQVIFRGIVDQHGAVILDAAQFNALMNSVSVEQSVRDNIPLAHGGSTGKSLPLITSPRNHRITLLNQHSGNEASTFHQSQQQELCSAIDLQESELMTELSDDPLETLTLNASSGIFETNNVRLGGATENKTSIITVSEHLQSQPQPQSSSYVDVEPPIGKGPYQCKDCSKIFPKWPQFKRHKAEHLDEKFYRCSLCPMNFNFEINLTLHQMIHEAEISGCLECQECPAKFSRLASLKSHVRVHAQEEHYVCSECGEECATKARLDTHIEEHKTTKSLLYRCRLCGKCFTQAALLKDHAKEHTAVRNQLKILTPRRRKPKSNGTAELSKSRERSEKKKSLLCAICAKRFQKPSQLSRHVRIHTGEKPYACKHCDRSFNQKGTLESHILSMHEKLKPFVCHMCNCQFSQRGNLKAHVLKVHIPPGDNEKVFKCQECSCVYRRLATLNTHIAKSHSKSSQPGTSKNNASQNTELLTISKNEERVTTESQDFVPVIVQTPPIVSQEGEQAGSLNAMIDCQNLMGTSLQQQTTYADFSENLDHDAMNISGPLCLSGSSVKQEISEVKLAHETQSGKAITCVVNVKKIGQEKWHLCTTCTKSFRKPSDLIRHLRIHTLEKPFKCHICQRSFAVKSTLSTHLKTHTLEKDFECRVCSRRFSVMTSLRAHERLHTGSKPFICLQCGKGFRTSSQRRMHTKVHFRNSQGLTGKRKLLRIGDTEPKIDLPDPLKITSDGLVPVPNRASLSTIKPNTVQDCKIRPYRCTQCPSAFKKSSHLKQHNFSHSKERPYKCFQCSRSFISSGVLKNHIKTHEGVRAFKCNLCELSFTTNGSLTRHMVTHTDIRPFVCPYCHKTFKTSVSCRKHIKTHRSEFVAFRTNANDQLSTSVPNSSLTNNNTEEQIQSQDVGIVHDHQHFETGYQGSDNIYVVENEDDHYDHSFNMVDAASNGAMAESNSLLSSLPQNTSNAMDDCMGTMQQQIQDITELIAESGQHLSNSEGEVTLQYSLPTESQIEEVAHQISLADGQHFDGSIFNLQGGDSIELPAQLSSLLPHQQSHDNPPQTIQNALSGHSYVKFDLPPMESNNYQLKESHSFSNETNQPQPSNLEADVHNQRNEASMKDTRLQEIILSSKPISEQIYNEMTSKPITENGLRTDIQKYDGEIIETDKTKVNKCQHCGRGFRKRSDMLRHVRIHTGEKPFKCHICAKAFRVKSTREAHIRTHEGGKTVACHVCHNLFSTKSSLRVHIRLHTGAKPYKCPHCDRFFRTSGHRKNHILSHFKIPKNSGNATTTTVVSTDLNQTKHSNIPQQPVETITNNKPCPPQSTINTDSTVYTTSTVTNSVPDPVQIIGSLQLTLDGPTLQNIQITGLDLNNMQLSEDFLQSLGNVIFMTPNQLGLNSGDMGGPNSLIGLSIPNGDVSLNHLINSQQSHQDPSMSHMVNQQTASVLTGKDVNVGNTVTNRPSYSQRLIQNTTDSSTISVGDLDPLISDHTLLCGFSSLSSSSSVVPESTTTEKNNSTTSSTSAVNKQCMICDKVFSKPSLLKRHMHLHTGTKPYQCEVCQSTFNQKNSLDVHMYTHSNIRPFVCSLCPFKTVVKAALKKHCSRAHPNLTLEDVISTSSNDVDQKINPVNIVVSS